MLQQILELNEVKSLKNNELKSILGKGNRFGHCKIIFECGGGQYFDMNTCACEDNPPA